MPTGDRPQSSLADPSRRVRLGSVTLGLGTALALAAGVVLAWSVVSTASARISGATDNPTSLLEAAVIELTTVDGDGGGAAGAGPPPDGSRSDLLIDADGMYPGRPAERCIQLRYRGSLEWADVVLWADINGGTGLDRYLDTVVSVGQGTNPDCRDFAATDQLFTGTLAQLAIDHADYERGLLVGRAWDDTPLTVRFQLEVRSDNGAQGLTTAVHLAFEVRP